MKIWKELRGCKMLGISIITMRIGRTQEIIFLLWFKPLNIIIGPVIWWLWQRDYSPTSGKREKEVSFAIITIIYFFGSFAEPTASHRTESTCCSTGRALRGFFLCAAEGAKREWHRKAGGEKKFSFNPWCASKRPHLVVIERCEPGKKSE